MVEEVVEVHKVMEAEEVEVHQKTIEVDMENELKCY